jgi:hypothetical protein
VKRVAEFRSSNMQPFDDADWTAVIGS